MNQAEPPSAGSQLDTLTWMLVTAGILILLSMIFSAAESAFLSINKLRLRLLRDSQNKKAILTGKLLDKKDVLLNTILVANNIVNIALSAILTSVALELFGPAGVGYATIVVTILLLIFGEITPKTIGTHHPESIAFITAPLIRLLTILLRPLVLFFTSFSKTIAKLFGISFNKSNVSFTEDEIKSLIEVGEEEGILESNEKNMMHRVFKFTDMAAKDIMVPRTAMIAIPITTNYRSIIELSQKTHLSRFPVYKDNIDDICGIIYMKDMLFHSMDSNNFDIKTVMRPPLFILETKKMTSIQQVLRENRQTIAIVMDEYSGISGLLTVEDLSQEIFGPMYDEFDIPMASGIKTISENEMLVDGTMRLIDINEILHLTLASPFYETIGGYIFEKLDAIPKTGESVTAQGVKFTVHSVTDRKILKVSIQHGIQQ